MRQATLFAEVFPVDPTMWRVRPRKQLITRGSRIPAIGPMRSFGSRRLRTFFSDPSGCLRCPWATAAGWPPPLMSPDLGCAQVSSFTSLRGPPDCRSPQACLPATAECKTCWRIRGLGCVAQRSKGGAVGRRPAAGDMSGATHPSSLILGRSSCAKCRHSNVRNGSIAAGFDWQRGFCFAPVRCQSTRVTSNHPAQTSGSRVPSLIVECVGPALQQIGCHVARSNEPAPACRRTVARFSRALARCATESAADVPTPHVRRASGAPARV